MDQTYYTLTISAIKSSTEIWLGDDEGHFVAHSVGVLDEGLLPGDYVVSFGLSGERIPIHLDRDLEFYEGIKYQPQPEIEKEERTMLTNRNLTYLLLALAAMVFLAAVFGPDEAQGQEISPHAFMADCSEAATSEALVACVKLRLPEGEAHNLEKVLSVLGKPLGKGLSMACPQDPTTGLTDKENCHVFPSLVHRIADALVITAFTPTDEPLLIHLSINELSDEGKQRLDAGDGVPGFEPI